MIDNTRGILAMSAAVVVFIFNDALIKLAAETVPSAQAIGVRGLFATLWCVLALLATGAWRHARARRRPWGRPTCAPSRDRARPPLRTGTRLPEPARPWPVSARGRPP